jgi:hypothetical protein
MGHLYLFKRNRIIGLPEYAQAMVEFALMIPVLLMMIYGIIELSRLAQAYLTVNYAADAGARYAVTGQSITGEPNDRPQSIVFKARDAAAGLRIISRDDSPALEQSSTVPEDLDVWLSPEDAADPNDRAEPYVREPVTVTVSYNYSPIIPVSFSIGNQTITLIPSIITVVGSATMVNEQIDRVTPVMEGTFPATLTPGLTATSIVSSTTTPILSGSTTPTPSCLITGLSPTTNKADLKWNLTNSSAAAAQITSISINWPDIPTDQSLNQIIFAGKTLWDAKDSAPPTLVVGGWKGSVSDRTLNGSQTKELKFHFGKNVATTGFTITVTFSNGCIVNGSK